EPDNWWKSCDNTLARQLNERGKSRSTELGKVFKDLNYPITRVISSEFCRSVKTAELINSGPPIAQDARINHPEHNKTGKGLFNGMLEIMKEQPVDNKMTLMVLHHPVNETGTQGYPTFPKVSPFTWTGAYIVSVSADKTVSYQGAVSFAMFNYYRNLKLKKL
ncbi:MAG TPA: histidine phosphatase family protein, partial [Daejeonella sp.]|nr:histidine phosphatase family protein [Daejeonella sp.]